MSDSAEIKNAWRHVRTNREEFVNYMLYRGEDAV